MTVLRIELDDGKAEAIRLKAQQEGKSPEQWIADAAILRAQAADHRHWVDRLMEAADKTGGDSGGWKWNRDELYDE